MRAADAPVLESISNGASASLKGACSPGGAANLVGTRLTSANSDQVQVDVNGESVPVLTASATRVTFRCPELATGTPLEVVLRNSAGSSNSVQTEMHEVTPGIFTIDGARGSVVFAETAELALNAPDLKGVPARHGDIVSILCTGLGRSIGAEQRTVTAKPIVLVDGISAEVLSATAVEDGAYQVDIRIPPAASTGDAVSLEVQMPTMSGDSVHSNRVAISVEAAAPKE